MPAGDWKLRVTDILDSIAVIQEFTAGMDYIGFVCDRKTVDAVLRNITVIGERSFGSP